MPRKGNLPLPREIPAANLLRQDESRTVLQMVRNFSTVAPFDKTLRKQLNSIGIYLRDCLEADIAFHFFTNAKIPQMHFIHIGNDNKDIPEYKEEKFLVSSTELNDWHEVEAGTLVNLCKTFAPSDFESGKKFLFIPFSQHDLPFGHFILAFSKDLPSSSLMKTVEVSLNALQGTLKDILYNHYPITRFTYLPSFQSQQATEAAILFCDVRDSTAMHEIARMASDEKPGEMVVTLLKSFLEYSSRIISVPSVGRIYRFMGDGFLAMFGEHLTLEATKKAHTACALIIIVAKLLLEGFEELWEVTQQHPLYEEYLSVYNEDLDLRLGVGINYGTVRFDLFGIATEYKGFGEAPRGFYEFTPVGDNMNFTQRLCSVASQPLSYVHYVYRSKLLPDTRLTAPIMASRTVLYRMRESFHETTDPLSDYRTDFEHKGKGHPMPGFELWPDAIDINLLLEHLKTVDDGRFYTALHTEGAQSKESRPALKEVVQNYRSKLDAIAQK